MNRKIYHVVKDDSVWKVKAEGTTRSSANLDTKDQAVARATTLAKSSGLGQVKIHGLDGKIQQERTYGRDPQSSPG